MLSWQWRLVQTQQPRGANDRISHEKCSNWHPWVSLFAWIRNQKQRNFPNERTQRTHDRFITPIRFVTNNERVWFDTTHGNHLAALTGRPIHYVRRKWCTRQRDVTPPRSFNLAVGLDFLLKPRYIITANYYARFLSVRPRLAPDFGEIGKLAPISPSHSEGESGEYFFRCESGEYSFRRRKR